MEKHRKSRAAAPQQRRHNQQMISAALCVAICAIVIAGCAGLINMRMSSSSNVQQYQLVLPTLLPQGTLMPINTDNVSATAAPSDLSVDGANLNLGDNWMLILVNAANAVPDGYEIPEFTELSNGQKVDKRMYPSLQNMFDDARAQGVYPYVASGYRTDEEQQQLMDDKIAEYTDDGKSEDEAKQLAASYVAAVGYSEHQTGLAVDINAKSGKSTSEEVYTWMAEHCAEYGFILRYPDGKSDITGVSYEPWHFRYVGTEAAQVIMDGGLCLEEYLASVN